MSLRFNRGPIVLTVYHNPSSSQSALSYLKSQLNSSSESSNLSKGDGSSSNDRATGAEFLAEAASSVTGPDIQLELRDKEKQGPTPSQWRTIESYVKDRSAGQPKEGLMSKLESGDFLLVDWDRGWVATDEQGVRELVQKIKEEGDKKKGGKDSGGGGCSVL